MDSINAIDEALTDLVTRAELLNAQGMDTRSRQLSLAITKLEEARHWLRDLLG